MSKIRLLELRNTYKWGGGPDKTILLSAEKHDPSRVKVFVAYIRDVRDHEFQISDMARGRNLNYFEIPECGKFDFRVLKAIRDLVVRYDINVIHGHDYKSDLFAYLVGRWLCSRPIALVSTAHAWVMIGLRGDIYRRLDMFLMKKFDHLIAVSQATKDEMTAAGIPGTKITVIHNGIDTSKWCRNKVESSLREELKLPLEVPVVGYVGRIMPEKDLETWIRAAAQVAKVFPQAKFILVGEGRDECTLKDLQELACSLKVANQVHFLGYRRNLLPVYATFDLFVMSSLREGLPNSILEAMALGLPVVTTDVAGAKEIVIDGETGFVVSQKSPNELATAILKILGEKHIQKRMGQAGRDRIEREFSFLQRLKCVENLYDRVVVDSCRDSSSKPGMVY